MDTIYSLFQKVVKEHENAPAIIENDRTTVSYTHLTLPTN